MTGVHRVCLDLTPTETRDRYGGFTRYGLALLEHLLALPPSDRADLELLAITRSDGTIVRAEDVRPDAVLSGPVLPSDRHVWQRRRLGRALAAERVDLFHALYPEHVPRARRTKVVATVYDLVTDVLPPSGTGFWRRIGRRIERRWEYRGIDHCIAISDTTRADLARFAGIRGPSVDVVPLGVDVGRFSPGAPPSERRRVTERFGLPGRYFLSVGSDHYRKNQALVFEAWQQASGRVGEGLVLVGKALYGDTFSRIASAIAARSLGARVVWLDDVDDGALPALYRCAAAVVAPSLYEGFGLTLLEAMACGAPVIASTAPAHREVAADAALYFDPRSAADLAGALVRCSSDESVGGRLRARGLARAREYTWAACARRTVEVYRRVLAGTPA